MIAQISNYVLGAIGSCYVAMFGVIYWTSRTKVNHKTFDVERENNRTEHQNIRKWIEDAEERSENRHGELTKKLDKIEDLIRNNGHATPRIRT